MIHQDRNPTLDREDLDTILDLIERATGRLPQFRPCLEDHKNIRKLRDKVIDSLAVHKREDLLIEKAWEMERIRKQKEEESNRLLEKERDRIIAGLSQEEKDRPFDTQRRKS